MSPFEFVRGGDARPRPKARIAPVATPAAGRKLPFIVTVRGAVVRRQGVARRQERVPRITPVSDDAGLFAATRSGAIPAGSLS